MTDTAEPWTAKPARTPTAPTPSRSVLARPTVPSTTGNLQGGLGAVLFAMLAGAAEAILDRHRDQMLNEGETIRGAIAAGQQVEAWKAKEIGPAREGAEPISLWHVLWVGFPERMEVSSPLPAPLELPLPTPRQYDEAIIRHDLPGAPAAHMVEPRSDEFMLLPGEDREAICDPEDRPPMSLPGRDEHRTILAPGVQNPTRFVVATSEKDEWFLRKWWRSLRGHWAAERGQPDGVHGEASGQMAEERAGEIRTGDAGDVTHSHLLQGLPEGLRQRVVGFDTLPIEEQAVVLEELERYPAGAEAILRQASLERKAKDPTYEGFGVDLEFMDPTIHEVQKGHLVEIVYEEPGRGYVSRSQARFLDEIATDAEKGHGIHVAVLDDSDEDIQRLGALRGSHLLQAKPEGEEDAEDNVIPIHGMGGLLRLMSEHPDHPGISHGVEAFRDAVRRQTSRVYTIERVTGVVAEPPGDSNEGVLRLVDGTEIEMCNVRLINIIGADRTLLLDRGPDEIYKGRPVRVWYNGKWHEARVVDPDSYRGLIVVKTEEKVHDDDHYDGHGLTVHRESADIDLRDPATTAPREHPLMRYPQIKEGVTVAFIDDQTRIRQIGVIDGISSATEEYRVATPEGDFALSFAESGMVEFLPPVEEAVKDPRIRRGNRIGIFDANISSTRVYEIIGYDPKTDTILGKMRSVHAPRGPFVRAFSAKRWLKILGNGDTEREKLGLPKILFPGRGRFRWDGKILTGEITNIQTLPFYIQMWDRHNDRRYDVPPEDFIELIPR